MKKICTGYAMYFNRKYKHSGVIFQGRFKATHINTNEQLLYTSAYVNCNCEIHGFSKTEKYAWSSFKEYTNKKPSLILERDSILGQFKNKKEYFKYALGQIDNMKKIKGIFIE